MKGYGVSQAVPMASYAPQAVPMASYAPQAAPMASYAPQAAPMASYAPVSMPISQPVLQGYQTMPTNGIPMATGVGASYRTAGAPMQPMAMPPPAAQPGQAPGGVGARPMTNFDMATPAVPPTGQV